MSLKRNIYLRMQSLEAARQTLMDAFAATPMESETINATDAVGRVLALPVTAQLSSPNFNGAAMDGVAVCAADTFGASEGRPLQLRLETDAHWINTGHAMPPGADAVIMIERIQQLDAHTIQIEAPVFPWQHVRKMGEDIVATELLFPRNHRITAYCLGALLAGGVFQVAVRRQPRVLIIPTGSELVDWRRANTDGLAPGQVIESNGYVLAELIESLGAICRKHEKVVDDPDLIEQVIETALQDDYQMIMTVGGSSAGSADYARHVVERLGQVLVHGVTMMPGKPVLIANVGGRPFFGMPGYPVSAIMAFEQFVQPMICRLLGVPEPVRPAISAHPTRKMASKLGVEEFVRVKLGRVGDKVIATGLPRGAGSITTITEADGIIRIGADADGLKDDQPVTARLLRPADAIAHTLVAVGSHDNTLDLLADELRARFSRLTLSSSHVGSMGGLMAIRKGGCHLAGSHLLDTDTGAYNLSYIDRYLKHIPVKVVNLVLRDQGLIVPSGNPKNIQTIEDLAREDVRLINRQGGSGTRILLDYRLRQLGLAADRITGYDQEEFTHMTVAAAVLGGAADVGLGICAAARALNLDFIPVVTEQYDLVIPLVYYETTDMQRLLDTIASGRFKQRVRALGGYSTDRTGEII